MFHSFHLPNFRSRPSFGIVPVRYVSHVKPVWFSFGDSERRSSNPLSELR